MNIRVTLFFLALVLNTNRAATFSVINLNDSGSGSFRQAISDANSLSGPHIINFDIAGTVFITSAAFPEIQVNITLNGNGGGTTVDGSGIYQILEVSSPANFFEVNNINFQNGFIAGVFSGNGGAILVNSNIDVNLNNCNFSNNEAETQGGAVFFGGNGTYNINDCSFTANEVNSFFDAGGGLYINSGTSTITGCTFEDNKSRNEGGGAVLNGNCTLSNSSFIDNNSGAEGGGAAFDGIAIVTACNFSSNNATDGGGAFAMGGGNINYTFTECTFENNRAADDGGGLLLEGSGTYTFSVSHCTFSNNTATDDAGGLFLSSAGTFTGTVINSTMSGNIANEGAGVYFLGGGTPNVSIVNCTMNNNEITAGNGGALFISGSLSLINCILANSIGATDYYQGLGATLITNDHNMVETCSVQSGSCPSFFSTLDPTVTPLQDNGGRTETHGLIIGSPAIGMGNAALAPAEDQRGFPRDIAPDIGAFEGQVLLATTIESFTAKLETDYVNLQWSIGTEKEWNKFILMRSADLEHWTTVGTVEETKVIQYSILKTFSL